MRTLPADDHDRANILAHLGNALIEAGRPAEAEPVLRECLAAREKKRPDDWSTFNVRSLLGAALASQKKYVEAEPLLVQGYEGLKQRADMIPDISNARLPAALGRLVQLYEAWGKPAEAARWRAERAKYPPEQAPRPRAVVR